MRPIERDVRAGVDHAPISQQVPRSGVVLRGIGDGTDGVRGDCHGERVGHLDPGSRLTSGPCGVMAPSRAEQPVKGHVPALQRTVVARGRNGPNERRFESGLRAVKTELRQSVHTAIVVGRSDRQPVRRVRPGNAEGPGDGLIPRGEREPSDRMELNPVSVDLPDLGVARHVVRAAQRVLIDEDGGRERDPDPGRPAPGVIQPLRGLAAVEGHRGGVGTVGLAGREHGPDGALPGRSVPTPPDGRGDLRGRVRSHPGPVLDARVPAARPRQKAPVVQEMRRGAGRSHLRDHLLDLRAVRVGHRAAGHEEGGTGVESGDVEDEVLIGRLEGGAECLGPLLELVTCAEVGHQHIGGPSGEIPRLGAVRDRGHATIEHVPHRVIPQEPVAAPGGGVAFGAEELAHVIGPGVEVALSGHAA